MVLNHNIKFGIIMEYRVFKQTVRGMLGINGELSNVEWEYMGNLWMARMGEEIKDIRKWGEEEMMSYDERLVGVEAMRVMMFLRIMREVKESEGNGVSDGFLFEQQEVIVIDKNSAKKNFDELVNQVKEYYKGILIWEAGFVQLKPEGE